MCHSRLGTHGRPVPRVARGRAFGTNAPTWRSVHPTHPTWRSVHPTHPKWRSVHPTHPTPHWGASARQEGEAQVEVVEGRREGALRREHRARRLLEPVFAQ